MKHIIFTVLGIVLLTVSCQYAIDDYEQEDQLSFLKVDASLTPVFAQIKLVKTSSVLIGNAKKEVPVIPDEAYVRNENTGERFNLPLNGDLDTTFRGNMGEVYTLHFMVDSREYASQPEQLKQVPNIDLLNYTFSTREDLPEEDFYKHGFDVWLECRDLDQQGDYYHWTWVNYTKRYRCGTKRRFQTEYNLDCEVDCWNINYHDKTLLFSDIYTNGVTIRQPIVRVPYYNYPEKYYLNIEQRAITKHVFDYLEAVREQTESNGTPFDVPPQTQFSTNVSCISDPSEKILGVFNVYNYQRKIIYVDRSIAIPGVYRKSDAGLLLPVYQCVPAFPPPCKAPCQENFYVTKTRPEGWVD